MAEFNLSAAKKKAEEEGLIGSGSYLKLKEGDNRMRLMSECLPHAGEYQGRKTFKWLAYVLDRADNKIKPFFMANSIYEQIEALQLNPEYEFKSVPMPYDITINAKGAGTKEVVYTVMGARANTPLTPTEAGDWTELEKTTPIRELQRVLKEDKAESTPQVTADPQGPSDFDRSPIQIERGDLPR